MKVYLRAFINYEQNDWIRLFSITEFTYNNAKNVSIGHMPFKFNCGYYLRISYGKDINSLSKLQSADELLTKL